MLHQLLIALLSHMGVWVGYDNEQSYFAATMVLPMVTPAFLGLLWALWTDLAESWQLEQFMRDLEAMRPPHQSMLGALLSNKAGSLDEVNSECATKSPIRCMDSRRIAAQQFFVEN